MEKPCIWYFRETMPVVKDAGENISHPNCFSLHYGRKYMHFLKKLGGKMRFLRIIMMRGLTSGSDSTTLG